MRQDMESHSSRCHCQMRQDRFSGSVWVSGGYGFVDGFVLL